MDGLRQDLCGAHIHWWVPRSLTPTSLWSLFMEMLWVLATSSSSTLVFKMGQYWLVPGQAGISGFTGYLAGLLQSISNAIQRFRLSLHGQDWWQCWCCWETAPSTAPYSLCYHHPSATWYSIPDPKTGAPYSLCTPRFIPRMAMLAPGNRPITTDNKLSWVKWAKKRAMKPSPTVAPIPILRFSLRNKDNEKRGTLPGAPLLFFAFSWPYSQLISLMAADEKVKGYFKKGRWGGVEWVREFHTQI